MHKGYDGSQRELPFEAKPDIGENHEIREHERPDRRIDELLRHGASDLLAAQFLRARGQRLEHLVGSDFLRFRPTLLLGEADQKLVVLSKVLELDFADAKSVERCPELRRIHRRRRLHLHQRAALEVDPEVQAVRKQENDGPNNGDDRKREAQPEVLHEMEVHLLWKAE